MKAIFTALHSPAEFPGAIMPDGCRIYVEATVRNDVTIHDLSINQVVFRWLKMFLGRGGI
jgi:hypothetical protein